MAQHQFQVVDYVPTHFSSQSIDTHNGKGSIVHVFAHNATRKELVGVIFYNPSTHRWLASSITHNEEWFDLCNEAESFCRISYRLFVANRQAVQQLQEVA